MMQWFAVQCVSVKIHPHRLPLQAKSSPFPFSLSLCLSLFPFSLFPYCDFTPLSLFPSLLYLHTSLSFPYRTPFRLEMRLESKLPVVATLDTLYARIRPLAASASSGIENCWGVEKRDEKRGEGGEGEKERNILSIRRRESEKSHSPFLTLLQFLCSNPNKSHHLYCRARA